MGALAVIVPTRSRPQNVPTILRAWQDTGADAIADLIFVVDIDDPRRDAYLDHLTPDGGLGKPWVLTVMAARWEPLVPKLNNTAVALAHSYRALGFAGDDHVPRTPGWAEAYVKALDEMGTGIVYGDDGTWHGKLCTEWAMSASIVQELGRMVPADVEHLYCDNAVMELGEGAACLGYLPQVFIEHMHYTTGKAPADEQYARVNDPRQYDREFQMLKTWRALHRDAQIERVKNLGRR